MFLFAAKKNSERERRMKFSYIFMFISAWSCFLLGNLVIFGSGSLSLDCLLGLHIFSCMLELHQRGGVVNEMMSFVYTLKCRPLTEHCFFLPLPFFLQSECVGSSCLRFCCPWHGQKWLFCIHSLEARYISCGCDHIIYICHSCKPGVSSYQLQTQSALIWYAVFLPIFSRLVVI